MPAQMRMTTPMPSGTRSFTIGQALVLAPDPAWVRTLPHGKLPDRSDFKQYATDLRGRMAVWRRAVAESERLADDLAAAVAAGPGLAVEPL